MQADDTGAIDYLLNRVETSTLTFIRNGKPHTGKKAAAHMERKRKHFKGDIKSAEDFIRLAGTKSELTGKPYMVLISSTSEVRCDVWLAERLKEFRGGQERRN